jgi:DNA mismatch repair protein MutS
MTKKPKPSPFIRQWQAAKIRHPDCILLFRMGDFWETFFKDAQTIAPLLGLTLTTKNESIPMTGFPKILFEKHLKTLLNNGFKVAVCELVDGTPKRQKIERITIESTESSEEQT